MRIGLIGGAAWGAVQAVWLGGPQHTMMGLPQWADVLTYSVLAHGVLGTLNGVVVGGAFGMVVVLCRPVRDRIAAGPMALAVFLASATCFSLWPAAWHMGVGMARGIHTPWVLVIAAVWLLTLAGSYVVAWLVAGTRIGTVADRAARIAIWPAVVFVVAALVAQIVEAPRLMEPTLRWSSPGTGPGDPRPNIVLVVLDTQRVDRLGCYGYPRATSPRLDAFAADALVFENGISAAIWTLPSHASIFTGLFPSEHGATYDHRWLDDEFTTIAEMLAAEGYETVALSNNYWVSGITNVTQGFDRVLRPASIHYARGNSVAEFADKVLYPAGVVGKWVGVATAEDTGAKYTNQLASRWLAGRDRSRPFFLFVNYMEPHDPYRPHLPHRELFVERADIGDSYRTTWGMPQEFSLLGQDVYTERELELLNRVYDGETRLVDDYLGDLIERLAEHVPLDDALIVITSDHGENLGDHHLQGHTHCVYDTLAHVPLVVRYPPRLRPGRSADLVQTVDLLPTVIDAAAGRPVPTASTFGRSLLGQAPEDRVAVIERIAPQSLAVADPSFDPAPFLGAIRAIRRGSWKYIVWESGREELFDLDGDPGEAVNLIDERRDIADALAGRLEEWMAASRPYAAKETPEPTRALDDKARERLRALGYID